MADTTTQQQATEVTSAEGENVLKRSHPEYDAKTQQELVDTEKRKIQKIQTLVHEVQEGTKAIDAKIAVAKESKDMDERKELITDIQSAAAEVKTKVLTAAKLEEDVVEINTVLKEKKKAEEAVEGVSEDDQTHTRVADREKTSTTNTSPAIITESVPPTSTQ